MFRLDTEKALLDSFRPRDRTKVELPADVTFPLHVSSYFAWPHPAGGRVFLVFAVPGGLPTGIVFDGAGGAGVAVPSMCEWCHSSGLGTGVGMLSARLNGKKRLGVHICTDLSCKGKLEDEANRSGASVQPALERLVERMGRFASEGLGIDLFGSR